tara:strand:- start:207 stop:1130 length:924 start_codon:yes stop_codon:yes gene_type:complete
MNIPWTEKYRPSTFENIILEENNKNLLENIIQENRFTNLLFHGPPGTGKTTTIINLINKYQQKYNQVSKSLIIHLNASDERGIEIIRNNLYNFVNSDCLFNKGTKFIILDEVDYMTRTAQLALKCLIQEYNNNIKYCLICNYISKIELSLQNEFIQIRFNELGINNIYNYLKNILDIENKQLSNNKLHDIIKYYDYDLRSMINYIQSNIDNTINIPKNNIYKILYQHNINKNIIDFSKILIKYENKYYINKSLILKNYLFYILENYSNHITLDFYPIFEYIIHNIDNIDNNNYILEYIYYFIKKIFK